MIFNYQMLKMLSQKGQAYLTFLSYYAHEKGERNLTKDDTINYVNINN